VKGLLSAFIGHQLRFFNQTSENALTFSEFHGGLSCLMAYSMAAITGRITNGI